MTETYFIQEPNNDNALSEKMKKIAERYMNSESESEKAKLLDEGAALAQEILKKNPDDDSAHYMLAQDALKKKKYQNALD